MIRRAVVVPFVAAALLASCAASSDPVELMVAGPDAPRWEALMTGEIVVDPSGCVLLDWDGPEAPLLVIWPAGTERVPGDPGGVTSSEHGSLSFGATVELGGGEGFDGDGGFFGAEPPPEDCEYASVFLVSSW